MTYGTGTYRILILDFMTEKEAREERREGRVLLCTHSLQRSGGRGAGGTRTPYTGLTGEYLWNNYHNDILYIYWDIAYFLCNDNIIIGSHCTTGIYRYSAFSRSRDRVCVENLTH